MPRVLALAFSVCLLLCPAQAAAQTQGVGSETGGVQFGAPEPAPIVVAGSVATLLPDGTAAAPADAPIEVQNAIHAANRLVNKPYKYGGGHARIEDRGYDCSGTVSYALHHAGLLKTPLDSGSFMRWGLRGPGTWISVYANRGHAYAIIAGLRLDTSAAGVTARVTRRFTKAMERGPRWRPTVRDSRGYRVRHPEGF
jgi:hypothetical protein